MDDTFSTLSSEIGGRKGTSVREGEDTHLMHSSSSTGIGVWGGGELPVEGEHRAL